VSHFISGEGVREFIRDCTRRENAEG
jgi:hypothetical protein